MVLTRFRSFQEWMAEAIRRADGNQSELARLVRERFPGTKCSPQAIQYLADATRAKPATGSKLSPKIAAVVGLNPDWTVEFTGDVDKTSSPAHEGAVAPGDVQINLAVMVDGVELTREALQVAKLFMELPGGERRKFRRRIEIAAKTYGDHVPDGELDHLAAPGTAAAKRAASHIAQTKRSPRARSSG